MRTDNTKSDIVEMITPLSFIFGGVLYGLFDINPFTFALVYILLAGFVHGVKS